jgi:uncharacterized protein DUF1579
MKRIAILAALCLGSFALAQEAKKPAAGAPAAAAQPKPPAGPPKPAPEMKQLDFFLGTWKCDGKMLANPMGPEHAMKTTATGKTDLDGFWVSVRVEEKKTKDSPMPIKGNFQMTYDAAGKKFQAVWVDNFGGWGPATSTGWEGDKMTFTGEMFGGGQKMGSRDSFTKKSDKEMVHVGEMQMGGKWSTMMEETCKK